MTALPAPEPPAAPTAPSARRDDGPHATLTFYWDRDGLTAHGPYPGLGAGDEAALRNMRADHTAATYPLALAAPGPDPSPPSTRPKPTAAGAASPDFGSGAAFPS